MNKKGPRREIIQATKVGEHGSTSWYVELRCGHSYTLARKPRDMGTTMCCKRCVNIGAVVQKPLAQVFAEETSDIDYMSDIRARAKIAHFFKVDMDSVHIMSGTATIFIDAIQLARVLES